MRDNCALRYARHAAKEIDVEVISKHVVGPLGGNG